jgi:hypothetical protein
LISSGNCPDVEGCLVAKGYSVVRAATGGEAVSQTRRGAFDAAVIVSTGREMGLVETVLNLRDIRQAMPIIVVLNRHVFGESEFLTGSLPDTKIVHPRGLGPLLDAFIRR